MTRAAVFVALVAAALVAAPAHAAFCHGKPSPDAPENKEPVYTQAPVFVRQVPNGVLYRAGTAEDAFNVLHVYGTPYECGFAQGSVLKQEVTEFVNVVYAYIVDQIDEALNSTKPGELVPHWLLDDVAEFGIDAALDLEIAATRAWTPPYFLEEIKGLADATGLSYLAIERIHLLGELTKGGCSLLSAYDRAIDSEYSLLGFRALDWSQLPFTDYSAITVYHPSGDWGPQGPGRPFINVGFSGFIGSFNGMTETTGTQEIGVTFADSTFGHESRFGIPFTYLLRDLIQFDDSVAAAEARIANAKRTCNLILGFADASTKPADGEPFTMVQYSASVANFFNSSTLQPDTDWHPRVPDLVYAGMDWDCPNYDIVFHRQLTNMYGTLTPELIIQNVTAIVETGDTFISVYAFKADGSARLYQAFGRSDTESGPDPAYQRQFTELDVNALLALTPPSL